jgi:hypothetical protein
VVVVVVVVVVVMVAVAAAKGGAELGSAVGLASSGDRYGAASCMLVLASLLSSHHTSSACMLHACIASSCMHS